MDGATAVAANINGNQVRLIDVSNPANPVLKGLTSVGLVGCGAVAIHGNLVAVGEIGVHTSPRIALLNISDLNNPRVIGTPFTTSIPTDLNSLAFLDRNVVVGAGPNDFHIVKVDFSNPASPNAIVIPTGLPGAPTLDADSSSHLVVVGNQGGGQVKLFDQNLNQITSADSMLPGIASVSLAGRIALVGELNDPRFAVVDFSDFGKPIVKGLFNNMVGVSTVAFDGQFGAFASQSGTPSLSLFDLRGAQPTHLGTLGNVGIGSVMSISMRTPAHELLPDIAADPTTLDFGAVTIPQFKERMVRFSNPGEATLNIGFLQTSDAHFTLPGAPPTLMITPRASASLTVRFTPDAAGPIRASLTVRTNVPRVPIFSVPLTGTGEIPLPKIKADPQSLAFGNVGIFGNEDLMVQLSNPGQAELDVSDLKTTDDHFVLVNAPMMDLKIQPSNSAMLTPRFMPGATVGLINANFMMTTNVPTIPTFSVPLSGTGVTGPGVIQGHVTDVTDAANPNPIPDASVLIGSIQLSTDSMGFYTLRVDPGVYNVSAIQSGFVPSRDTVTVPALKTITKDFPRCAPCRSP
jgi:hypothetical protein